MIVPLCCLFRCVPVDADFRCSENAIKRYEQQSKNSVSSIHCIQRGMHCPLSASCCFHPFSCALLLEVCFSLFSSCLLVGAGSRNACWWLFGRPQWLLSPFLLHRPLSFIFHPFFNIQYLLDAYPDCCLDQLNLSARRTERDCRYDAEGSHDEFIPQSSYSSRQLSLSNLQPHHEWYLRLVCCYVFPSFSSLLDGEDTTARRTESLRTPATAFDAFVACRFTQHSIARLYSSLQSSNVHVQD